MGTRIPTYMFCKLTAFTAGGIKDVDIATPTSDEMLSLRTAKATAAPDNNAIRQPTPIVRNSPLKIRKKNKNY